MDEARLCKDLLSAAHGKPVNFNSKLDCIMKKLMNEFKDQEDARIKVAGTLLILAGRYGLGLAPVSTKRWGLYRFWTTNAKIYMFNLLRSPVFGEPSEKKESYSVKPTKRRRTIDRLIRLNSFDPATMTFLLKPSMDSKIFKYVDSPLRKAAQIVKKEDMPDKQMSKTFGLDYLDDME